MKRLLWSTSLVSRSEYLFIQNSSNLSGSGKTNLAANTASLVATYTRPGAAPSVMSLLALGSATSAYLSSGFLEVSQVTVPGLYRLDVPDAALATGVDKCVVELHGADGMVPCVAEYQLDTELDLDATFGIVCRGTTTANSGTTTGTLGTVVSGALTNVQAGDVFAPAGLPARIFKTFDTSTGSWTVETAFISNASGLAARVFGSAPADSSIPVYADTVKLSGDATAADNAESFFDGTGYAGTGNTIPTVTTVTGGATSALLSSATAELLAQFPSGFSAGQLSGVTTVTTVTGGATSALLSSATGQILAQFPSAFSAGPIATVAGLSAATTSLLAQFSSNFSKLVVTSGGTVAAQVASLVSADMKYINSTAVTGNGGTTPWGP